ncbi:hypothetical protein ACN20G_10660 [Streptomyces sp. BI20]|uniref:hypothetical protein n=1 Tax=Streptomyces sp. BI20 TaxID=3403460 RepID=UPI003C773FB0
MTTSTDLPPDLRPDPRAEAEERPDFADEARSREARLLRMAGGEDGAVRARIVAYAAATPDPPLMGPHGIETAGCPVCRQTMWRQPSLWVCAACGHMRDA